jgi:hypothetical protein
MSAELIDLAQARAKRARTQVLPGAASEAVPATETGSASDSKAAFLFWTGASGARYVHSIYNLFECPPVSAANYVLVKRHGNGQRTVLSIGRAVQNTGALNLAEIRLRSAQLGANEVHVHLLADDSVQSQEIEADLRRSLVMA